MERCGQAVRRDGVTSTFGRRGLGTGWACQRDPGGAAFVSNLGLAAALPLPSDGTQQRIVTRRLLSQAGSTLAGGPEREGDAVRVQHVP